MANRLRNMGPCRHPVNCPPGAGPNGRYPACPEYYQDPQAELPAVLCQQLSPDLLLTRREVEAEFGISVRYLEVSVARTRGPPLVKIGRMVRYRVGDIRNWIAAHRV